MDLEINGIPVIFPHRPYDIQIDYMKAVITALQKKQNALLESPTGTGKTLSLLCSTLAWLDDRKFQDIQDFDVSLVRDELVVPNDCSKNKKDGKKGKGWKNENQIRIIYSSRTHSQLNQACAELKNSYYKFCSTVTIGSREQLCINQEVTKLETIGAKNQACRFKVKNNQCNYHHNYEQKVSELGLTGSNVYDIEDLVKFGNEHKSCPYYMAKAKSEFNTSLIFMPYNYVLDPNIRRTLKLNLENTVIIFDEGHNIEKVCEDSMSTELKSEWLALFISTYDSALQALKLLDEGKYDGTNEKELADFNIHEVAKVKMTICDLEAETDALVKKDKNSTKSYHATEDIFKIMNKIGLDYAMCGLICSTSEKIITYVMNSTTVFMTNAVIAALSSVCSFIEMVMPFSQAKDCDFPKYKAEFIRNYRLYTEMETENSFNKNAWAKKKSQDGWTLYLWCMSPSVAIKSLQNLGVYNLIITSGTLSPLESFECEMGISFPVKLQNSHVITKNQLAIKMIFKDPNGRELSGSFENRNNSKYYDGLGLTVIELSRTVPKGIFIFFSSYSLINRCIEMWKSKQGVNLWNSITSLKRVFVEPKNKNEFNVHIQSFKETIDTTKDGAIFMGVSRGKLSEGMDLGDDYCRAVIIIGLPYPARYDPRVVLKQKYLDETNAKMNGIKWYMLQMKRALNQSIGRVIRHRNDYGTIVLCDSRFKQLNDGLSKWISPFLSNNPNTDFRCNLSDIQFFFQKMQNFSGIQIDKASSASQLTSGGSQIDTKDTKRFPAKNESVSDIVVGNVFDSMKSGYTNIKNSYFGCKPESKCLNDSSNSIFDSLCSSPSSVKRSLSSTSSLPLGLYCDNKKSKQNYATSNFNQFLTNSPENVPINNRKSNYFPSSQSSTKVCDEKLKDVATLPIQKQEINDAEIQRAIKAFKCNLSIQIDCEILDIVFNEIRHSAFKCRQLMQTLEVFAKKRNVGYLSARLDFILADIEKNRRESIQRELLSLIVS